MPHYLFLRLSQPAAGDCRRQDATMPIISRDGDVDKAIIS